MQELKFKIKGTEAAQVEIVPVSDGVEIIVRYGSEAPVPSQERKPFKPRNYAHKKSNIDILKDFCGGIKENEGVDVDELLRFYKFYESKIEEWKGTIEPEKLWKRWMETAK